MRNSAPSDARELEALETREWLESLDYVLQHGGPARVGRLLRELGVQLGEKRVLRPGFARRPRLRKLREPQFQALVPRIGRE